MVAKKKTKQFLLRIEIDALEHIEILAAQQNRTVTQQINFMLKQQLKDEKDTLSEQEK